MHQNIIVQQHAPLRRSNVMHNYRVFPIITSNPCISYTRVITFNLNLVSKNSTNALGGPLIKLFVKYMPLSSVIDIHFK